MAIEASAQSGEYGSIVIHPRRSDWLGAIAIAAIPPIMIYFVTGRGVPANQQFPTHSLWLNFFLSFALFAAFPVGIIVWSYLAYIRLYRGGVTWRKGWRTFSFRWDDIVDYYVVSSASEQLYLTVVTTVGNLSLKSMMWNLDVFKDYVARHALKARATKWQELGTRPEIDWPLTINYNTLDSRLAIRVLQPVCWTFLVVTLAMVTDDMFRQYASDAPAIFPIDLAMDFVLLLVFVVPFVGMICVMPEMKSRQNEAITVGAEGLTFVRGQTVVRANWLEIKTLNTGGLSRKQEFACVCYSLATPDGPITFTSRIAQWLVLKRIIENVITADVKDL